MGVYGFSMLQPHSFLEIIVCFCSWLELVIVSRKCLLNLEGHSASGPPDENLTIFLLQKDCSISLSIPWWYPTFGRDWVQKGGPRCTVCLCGFACLISFDSLAPIYLCNQMLRIEPAWWRFDCLGPRENNELLDCGSVMTAEDFL